MCNQEQVQLCIVYFKLTVSLVLSVCQMSLNLCLPEHCLVDLSPYVYMCYMMVCSVCVFCLYVSVLHKGLSFIEQYRIYPVGEGMGYFTET